MFDTTRLRAELGTIQAHLSRLASGPRAAELVEPLRATSGLAIPTSKLLWQALHADCLRIAYVAIAADETITDDEVEALYDYLFSVARHYADVLHGRYATYAALRPDEPDLSRSFLELYAADPGPFGFHCTATRWAGLETCRRAATVGDVGPLDRYERLLAWLCDEALVVGGVDEHDARHAARLEEIAEIRRSLAGRIATVGAGIDLRAQAFLTGRRVFSSVAQADSVFEPDPFDVPQVHADARETFERLVEQAATPTQHQDRGRLLLVLGDSGAGKTHLMRAFRQYVHERGLGFATYAQLHSRSPDYGRYLLHNVLESLERPYAGPARDASGLLELAGGLARLVGPDMGARVARLAHGAWPDQKTVSGYVDELVDDLLANEELERFDPDLLRALLHLQRRDSRATPRVLKYLRCEPMNDRDRTWIGDVQPRTGADEPLRMIKQLARLAFVAQQAMFVMMVDQAELAGFGDETLTSFKRAVDTLQTIVSEVPSAIGVIACLGDVYQAVRPQLTKSATDRLENDPPRESLAVARTHDEIVAIVGRRLAWLYADAGAVHRSAEPTFPVPPDGLKNLANRRTRDVLDRCHQFQEACSTAGRIVDDFAWGETPAAVQNVAAVRDDNRLSTAWNDHLHGSRLDVPDEDDGILALLDDAARACAIEHEGVTVTTRLASGLLEVDLHSPAGLLRASIGVANRGYQRGAFGAQVDGIRAAAGARTAIVVRTTEFPQGPASNEKIAALLKAAGRKVVVPSSDLSALAAMREFARAHPEAALAFWRKRERPILGRASIAALFDLSALAIAPPAPPPIASPAVAPVSPAVTPVQPDRAPASTPSPTVVSRSAPTVVPPPLPPAKSAGAVAAPAAPTSATSLHVGIVSALDARPFELEPDELLRHSAVLGTSGSGKTTLALNVIEQLLERDVAVVLVDRKGDLAGYARPAWWRSAATPQLAARGEALASHLDVRLFTPGIAGGRPLAFGAVPRLDGVPDHERGRMVQHASQALAAMLRLGAGANDAARRAILTQAIDVLAERSAPAGLAHLIALLESRDDALIARAGRFDDKLFNRLVTDLETTRLNDAELFDPSAEQLSAELLLGRRDTRTPLSIVSTRFLGDNARIQAWVAQLLVELSRWCMRSPRTTLQALVMLDEADLYMPAGMARPPSKDPLQDLLRRARSGGLGVMLASQSPGDFDYKSRDLVHTWFIGKIGDKRSVDKVRPLLERKPVLAGKLPNLATGRFVVVAEDSSVEIERQASILQTEQLPEAEILQLARGTR